MGGQVIGVCVEVFLADGCDVFEIAPMHANAVLGMSVLLSCHDISYSSVRL